MSWRRGRAYSQDLRDRVLAAAGLLREVAERFGVSQAYVSRVRSRHMQLGKTSAAAQCNHVPLRLAQLHQALASEVAQHADQTLAQLCEWTQREHGVRVALSTMHKTLRRIGLSLKKRHCMPVSRSEAM